MTSHYSHTLRRIFRRERTESTKSHATLDSRSIPIKPRSWSWRREAQQRQVHARGADLEEVQNFRYLGSYISSDSNIEQEISTRLELATAAFNKLRNIWKSSFLNTKTKLKIYRSNVWSILLRASETGRGEFNRSLKVAWGALMEGAYGESSRSVGNSTSPIGKSVDKRVSTALSKKRSTSAGDG